MSVATILLDCTDDEAVIIDALLQDAIEDTPYEVSQMKTMFGDRITSIVQEVTHLIFSYLFGFRWDFYV